MNVVETIREKVFHLPPKAQKEVLGIVEQIEERYHASEDPLGSNGNGGIKELFGSVSLGYATGADNARDIIIGHEERYDHVDDH